MHDFTHKHTNARMAPNTARVENVDTQFDVRTPEKR
jgi:hypothetical protein